MLCAKCGKEIMEDVVVCPGCGISVAFLNREKSTTEQNLAEENIENIVAENSTTIQRQMQMETKKKFILSKKPILIFAVSLAVLLISAIVITNAISLNKYKEKLESAYDAIIYGAEKAESYASLQSKVWRNCIYNDSSTETDKYTKDEYGFYYADFNDALASFYEGESFTCSFVSANLSTVDMYMSELKDSPQKFKDEYTALKELYIAYLDLADLVVGSSSYSLNTFTKTLENAKSDYKSALSSAKLLLK